MKWSQRYRATGSVAPGKMGGHRKRVLEPHRTFIVERINQNPHLTLHGLKDELAARGVTVSHNAVWQFLRREGLRFKKTLFALEQARADIARRRQRVLTCVRPLMRLSHAAGPYGGSRNGSNSISRARSAYP